jgi:hypothetical protein
MASKKTTTKKTTKKAAPKATKTTKAAPKKAKASKAEVREAGPRHPRAKVVKLHGTKADLAKTLAPSLVIGEEDSGAIAERLATASNTQLLRLHHVVETVKSKYGSRDKLIEAISTAHNKSKDKDYLTKLATFSLPVLLDLATSVARSARA